jgi:hypothetical protein
MKCSYLKFNGFTAFSLPARVFAKTFVIFNTFRKLFFSKSENKFSRKYENKHFHFNPNLTFYVYPKKIIWKLRIFSTEPCTTTITRVVDEIFLSRNFAKYLQYFAFCEILIFRISRNIYFVFREYREIFVTKLNF